MRIKFNLTGPSSSTNDPSLALAGEKVCHWDTTQHLKQTRNNLLTRQADMKNTFIFEGVSFLRADIIWKLLSPVLLTAFIENIGLLLCSHQLINLW